jgi:hypothetical protein
LWWFITAPPKPSVQSQFLLDAMAAAEQCEDARWETLMESVDLLFAKVGVIDHNQKQLNTQMDLSAQIVERMLRDQESLAKQMELTGQAVARLTLDRHPVPPEPPHTIHTDHRSRDFQQGSSLRDKEVPLLTIIVIPTGLILINPIILVMLFLNCLFLHLLV